MKKSFIDIAMMLIMVVAIGAKTDQIKGAQQPVRTWTLEEASFLTDTALTQTLDRRVVQAVTRQNEGNECIFKCGMYRND